MGEPCLSQSRLALAVALRHFGAQRLDLLADSGKLAAGLSSGLAQDRSALAFDGGQSSRQLSLLFSHSALAQHCLVTGRSSFAVSLLDLCQQRFCLEFLRRDQSPGQVDDVG